MKCELIKRKISALIDRELSKDEEFNVAEHLKQCQACRLELEKLTELRNILVRIPNIEMPYYFRTRLMQSINDYAVISQSLVEKLRRLVLPAAASAAVILSLALGNYIGKNLYPILAAGAQPENESVEVLDFALNNFPGGSLSDMYQNVLNGEKNE